MLKIKLEKAKGKWKRKPKIEKPDQHQEEGSNSTEVAIKQVELIGRYIDNFRDPDRDNYKSHNLSKQRLTAILKHSLYDDYQWPGLLCWSHYRRFNQFSIATGDKNIGLCGYCVADIDLNYDWLESSEGKKKPCIESASCFISHYKIKHGLQTKNSRRRLLQELMDWIKLYSNVDYTNQNLIKAIGLVKHELKEKYNQIQLSKQYCNIRFTPYVHKKKNRPTKYREI